MKGELEEEMRNSRQRQDAAIKAKSTKTLPAD